MLFSYMSEYMCKKKGERACEKENMFVLVNVSWNVACLGVIEECLCC